MFCEASDGRRDYRVALLVPFLGLVLVAATGCHTVKVSEPPRTAIEQLLLSYAADDALTDADFSWLRGKRVFLDESHFEGYDKGYPGGLLRQRIAAGGAILVKTDDKAEIIVEVRSGALSVNPSSSFFGLPAITIPIPLAGPVQTPQITIYQNQMWDSIAKFSLFAYARDTGQFLKASGPMDGYAHFYLGNFLFISWRKTNVPELMKNPPAKFYKVPGGPDDR